MKLACTIFAATVLTAGAAQAQHYHYDHYGHDYYQARRIDNMALQLQRDAATVCWELHHHFRFAPGYRTIYREAYEMYTTSRYIHELAHHRSRLDTIQRSVVALDDLFHHLEEHFAELETWSRGTHRYYTSISHLRGATRRMGDTLHDLIDATGAVIPPREDPNAPPLPPGQAGARVPGQVQPLQQQPGTAPSAGFGQPGNQQNVPGFPGN